MAGVDACVSQRSRGSYPHRPFHGGDGEQQQLQIAEGSQAGETAGTLMSASETENGAYFAIRRPAVPAGPIATTLALSGAVGVIRVVTVGIVTPVFLHHGDVGPQHTCQAGAWDFGEPGGRVPDDGVVHASKAATAGAHMNRVHGNPRMTITLEALLGCHVHRSSKSSFSTLRCQSNVLSSVPLTAASTSASSTGG